MKKLSLNDFDEYFRMHGGTLWGVTGVHFYLSNFYEQYGDRDNYDVEMFVNDLPITEENEILMFIESSKETILQGLANNLYPVYYKDDFASVDEFLQNLKPVSVYIKNQNETKAEIFLVWQSENWRNPRLFKNCIHGNLLSIRIVLQANNEFVFFDNNGRQPCKGDS